MLSRGEYIEKRDFLRLALDCPLEFRLKGDKSKTLYHGTAKNLSASGLSIICQTEIVVGSELEVKVAPEQATVPPLLAHCEVKWVQAMQDREFELGLRMIEVMPISD